MDIIYLDNNATTRVDQEVIQEMLPYFHELYGNPSSMHSFGGEVGNKIAEAREQTARLLGAEPEEIIFTSCGTESDSTAIWSALQCQPDKKHIVTSRVEHPAVKNLYEHLAKQGYRVTFVPVDTRGRLNFDYLSASLTDDTALVSLMWANNETGVVFPIQELAEKVKEKGILFHSDAVQAAGKVLVDMKAGQADMLSISGHKIHAPKGVAALYVRKGTKFSPFLIGGHQERGRRGGTENTAQIIGFGKACELALSRLESGEENIRKLRDYLEQNILSGISKVMVNGETDNRLPNTSSISFEFIEGESILLMLDKFGICASSGSACTSGSLEPSHVLRAMGVPYTAAHGSIRFSLSHSTTRKEIDYVLDKLPPIIERLRTISPFWAEYQKAWSVA